MEDKKDNLYVANKVPSSTARYMKMNPTNYLIGNTYSVGRKIGAGNFGELHIGRNVNTNDAVAIKLEQTKAKTPQLVFEFRYYKMLNPHEGIPNALYYGQYNKYNALVMDLLGPNLEELFDMCNRKFSSKTVAMFTMQGVKRLEYVHSKHLIYRDMKPENFCIGRQTYQNIRTIYLVDFGLAKRYVDPETNLHIPFRDHKSLTGTARYMSVNTHLGYEQSRRDDLEALGNVAMYLLRGSLPWQGLKADTLKERYQKIGETKQKTTVEDLCKNQPSQMVTYFKYVRGLSFSATPDYTYLYNLLKEILIDRKQELDWEFDWLLKKGGKAKISASNDTMETEDRSDNYYPKVRHGASVQVLTSATDFLAAANDDDDDSHKKRKCCWFVLMTFKPFYLCT